MRRVLGSSYVHKKRRRFYFGLRASARAIIRSTFSGNPALLARQQPGRPHGFAPVSYNTPSTGGMDHQPVVSTLPVELIAPPTVRPRSEAPDDGVIGILHVFAILSGVNL